MSTQWHSKGRVLIGEDLRETFHHRGYQFVRLHYCSTRVIDEPGLDCAPARTEILERALLKQRRRGFFRLAVYSGRLAVYSGLIINSAALAINIYLIRNWHSSRSRGRNTGHLRGCQWLAIICF